MFKNMSLKVKLVLFFLLVGLIPMLTVGFLSYNSAQNSLREEVISGMVTYAHLAQLELEEEHEQWEGNAAILAANRYVYESLNILGELDGDTRDSEWRNQLNILEEFGTLVTEEMGFRAVFITDTSGLMVYASDNAVQGTDVSSSEYVRDAAAGNLSWSELYYSDIFGENIKVVSSPVRSGGQSGNVNGTLSLVIDQADIDENIHGALHELGETADAYLIDADGLLLSNTMLGAYRQGAALNERINTRAVEHLSGPIRSGNWNFELVDVYDDYLGNEVIGVLEIVRLGNDPVGLVIEVFTSEANAGAVALRNMIIPLIGVSGIVVFMAAYFVAMSIVRPVQKVTDLTTKIAKGDLTAKADINSRDEIGIMAESLNRTIDSLSETLSRVQETASTVNQASSEISSGNQDLSQRTEEQASSLEEVSSTIEEMTASLEKSSANASEADNMSNATLESVHQGEEVVKDMQNAMGDITRGSREIAAIIDNVKVAMDEITSGSKQISEIIGTVNDIAFQTNLLALNAAVEAARAGEQGRGFAVVASEVRNLAGRAAKSARDIEKLIKNSIVSVEKGNSLMANTEKVLNESNLSVEKGNELMSDTEKVLQGIVQNTQKSGDYVGEIAASLREQAVAAGEIRTSVEQLNQVTNQNASLVEEIASSSENMNSEAVELLNRVGFFQIESSYKNDGYSENKGDNGKSLSGANKEHYSGGNGKSFYQSPPECSGGNGQVNADDFDKF